MGVTREELLEAKRQIDSTLHKLRQTIITLQGKENPARYKSQITLAERRVKAFEIAVDLIEKSWKSNAPWRTKNVRGAHSREVQPPHPARNV